MSIRALAQAADWTASETRHALHVFAHAADVLRACEDDESAATVDALAAGMATSSATVVVCGEYKRGKSSLVNSLLAARVSPSDPLASTPVPVRIQHGADERLAVRVLDESGQRAEIREQVVGWSRWTKTLSQVRPELQGHRVDHADARLPHPLLRQGLVFVDTPSISGGIMSPAAATVLAAATQADVVILVTDASQELTAPEIEFLTVVDSLGPDILVAVTKTDLYPEWRRIVDLDQQHLEDAFADPPVMFPLSPVLRQAAVRYGDESLDRESGVGILGWYLAANVVCRARQRGIRSAAVELDQRLARAEDSVDGLLAALRSVEERKQIETRLHDAQARLERLAGRWKRTLARSMQLYRVDTAHDLSERFDEVRARMTDVVNGSDPSESWPQIEGELRGASNRAFAAHLVEVRRRAAQVVDELAEFLGVQGDLRVQLDEDQESANLAVDVDAPVFQQRRASRALMRGRIAGSTGAVTFGVTGSLLAGAGAIATVATGFLGVAAAVAAASIIGKQTEASDVAARRQVAHRSVAEHLDAMRKAATHHSNEVRVDLQFRLEEEIETRLGDLVDRTRDELVSLERQSRLSFENRPAEEERLTGLRDRIQLVRAHGRRLDHRLDRPWVEVPDR